MAEEVAADVFAASSAGRSGSPADDGFVALLHRFAIDDLALRRLAPIVQHTAPASGLAAICDGLRRIRANDVALTAAAMAIFDAYYQWARSASQH